MGEHFVPDLLVADHSSTGEDVLHALHLNIHQFVCRFFQAEVQLEAAEDRLLIDLHLIQLQLQQFVSKVCLEFRSFSSWVFA